MAEQRTKHTPYYWVGWILTFASIGFFISIFREDYKYLDQKTSLDLLSTFAQTTGVFLSLAGLFFVIDNLSLQRETIKQQQFSIDQQKVSIDLQRAELKIQNQELKSSNEYFGQQNETLRIQQAESTFFNLLKNHSDLVVNLDFSRVGIGTTAHGYDGLEVAVNQIREHLSTYKSSISNGAFENSSAFLNPKLLYETYPSLETVIKSILHIIELIETKLNNDEFYHKTFYYNLKDNEKFLLGMVVENSLITTPNTLFSYSQYFRKKSVYVNKLISGYFPPTEVIYPNKIDFQIKDIADIQEHEFKLIDEALNISYNMPNEKSKLVKIYYNYEFLSDTGIKMGTERGELPVTNQDELSLSFLVKDLIPELFGKYFLDSNIFKVFFKCYFSFEFEGKNFSIVQPKFSLGIEKYSKFKAGPATIMNKLPHNSDTNEQVVYILYFN